MKKYLKRFSALFVVVAMLVAMIPMTVLAEQEFTIKLSVNKPFEGKVEINNPTLTGIKDNQDLKTTDDPMELKHGDDTVAKATIKSEVVDGIEFIGWQLKGPTIVSGADKTVIAAGNYDNYKEGHDNDVKITAVFANKKTQQFASMDENKGTVSKTSADLNDNYDITIDGKTLKFNGEVICEANAKEGYLFVGWTGDDGKSTKKEGSILPKHDIGKKIIKAVFEKGYEVVALPTAEEVIYGTALEDTGIATNGSVKYDGKDITFGNGDGNYRWYWAHETTVPTVDHTGTNAYLLKLQINNKTKGPHPQDKWDDTGVTIEIPVPVTPKPVAITWTVGKYTYNGKVQTYPTAKYKDIYGTYIDCTVQINGEKEFKNYDADGYSFTASTDDANYKLINETISDVQIGKAPLTVKWTYDEPYVYGDGKTAPTVEPKGAVNDEEPVLTTPAELFGREFKDAGNYVFATKLADETENPVNANYYLQDARYGYAYSKQVSIYAKGVDLPQAVTGLVYNGEEQTGVSVGAQDPVHFENETGIEAKNYIATAILDSKTNYYWKPWRHHGGQDTKDKSVQFTIAPKDPEKADFVFTEPKNLEFTGDNKTAEVKLLDKYTDTDSEKTKNVVSLKYYKDGEEATKTSIPGTYTVKATVAVGNFTAAEAEVGSFTVQGVEITEGDGSKYVIGQDGTLTFKANGPYPLFEGIKIDGKTVDPSKYDKKAGSTYVTLHRDYTESLGAGEHTIQFIYDYNVSSNVADFTIQKPATPKTGDTNSTVVWIVLSAIAALAIFGCAYRVFRSEN